MLIKKPLTLTLIAGKAAALSVLMSGAVMAQAPAVVETPGAPVAVIPPAAATETPPQHIYPRTVDRSANDQAIAETLIAQGFSDVHILRDAAKLTVTAQRDNQPIELVYHLVRGELLSVNGQPVPGETPVDTSAGGQDNHSGHADGAGDNAADDDSATDDTSGDDGADSDASQGGESGDDGSSDSDGDSDSGEGADSES
ncbi:MAG: hypothetical protein Q4G24_16065 [Paracoccus sp. (in: a-proteobacteria)]|uniref:hypothetical protein n=1 Tax=Paracoccus sp. TaxID=267 RepID=UPI0026E0227C|nr:hypothetical protein [Paracoccus sp. (in: a-proteobacteria)]MDO5622962.1 hypothetical protein [Paracoccus sp. (in: a-proteobacteria)]